ncbi:MAG: ATPase, partial [Desulfobacterales bacterium]|nr:ATPase [Desulfobacterales bacterium]
MDKKARFESIYHTGGEMTHTFSHLIDLDEIKALMDGYCQAMGLASTIVDLDGNLLVKSNMRQICKKFHRANPGMRARCIESDGVLAKQLLQGGRERAVYRCKNGLYKAVAPIIIRSEHLLILSMSQFFSEPPDLAFFRKQASDFGLDESDYLNALATVPVIPRRRIDAILHFLTSFAKFLGEMGTNRI